MTNDEKIEAYLKRIVPRSATNAEIARFTAIQPHQQVFQITKRLLQQGRIRGGRDGNEWRFWASGGDGGPTVKPVAAVPVATRALLSSQLPAEPAPPTPAEHSAFEKLAQQVMARHYGTALVPNRVGGVNKLFDYVSADGTIVGDAKYFTLVRDSVAPPAKFSIVAEHVWLLEKTHALHTFLVFGNDRRVPMRWLEKYGSLVESVEFFFVDADGRLEKLH